MRLGACTARSGSGPSSPGLTRRPFRWTACFFEIVVEECDEILIAEILAGHIDPGSLVLSDRPFADVPTVEERTPEIRKSPFLRGRRRSLSTIPMLPSVGCL
jgi:hypothetical protein